MSELDLPAIRDAALDAAREAGDLLMEHLGRLDPTEIGRKTSARDLVTAADVASERLLVARLREAFPGHAIEAEEEVSDAPDDARPRWFLDPLDGTVNYVHRLPCFAVSMALYDRGAPRVAVVHAPRLGETFHAFAGGGAYVDEAAGRRRIRASGADALGESILATGFAYRRSELVPSNLEYFGRFFHAVRGLRRMGSAAVDLAYVADGRLDGYWEFWLAPHDVAAGALLVREAGGVVTDARGGEDWLRGGHIVAAGAGIHGAILARLGPD